MVEALTGSWSKGRSDYYPFLHCRPGCRAVNVTKAKLEGLFADELALLQPTPGYMRLLEESVLQIWKAKEGRGREEIANAERAANAIQDKLDRLDEGFLFERSIDIDTYDRHAEKLREELTPNRRNRTGFSATSGRSRMEMKGWWARLNRTIDPPRVKRMLYR